MCFPFDIFAGRQCETKKNGSGFYPIYVWREKKISMDSMNSFIHHACSPLMGKTDTDPPVSSPWRLSRFHNEFVILFRYRPHRLPSDVPGPLRFVLNKCQLRYQRFELHGRVEYLNCLQVYPQVEYLIPEFGRCGKDPLCILIDLRCYLKASRDRRRKSCFLIDYLLTDIDEESVAYLCPLDLVDISLRHSPDMLSDSDIRVITVGNGEPVVHSIVIYSGSR